MNGGNRQVVVSGTEFPLGVAIYEEYVYWTTFESIARADRFTGLHLQTVINTNDVVYTVRVNHPMMQPTG